MKCKVTNLSVADYYAANQVLLRQGKKSPARERMEGSAEVEGLRHPQTIGQLVAHFRDHELIDLGDDGKAYSTRNRCCSVLNKWVLHFWQATKIDEVRTVEVEAWLRGLPLANSPGCK
jgi:hypothetical protein